MALVVIAAVVFAAAYLYAHWPIPHPRAEMTINPGTSVRSIAKMLEGAGVIRCEFCFRAYVAARGYASKLRAGDYEFDSGLTVEHILQKLLKGDFKTYQITIPEGWMVGQIADYLKTLSFVVDQDPAGQFMKFAEDADFIRSLDIGWEVSNLEGYLFPSTYEVYKLKDVEKLAFLMGSEFKRKFSEDIRKKSKELGLTPEQVVTMASIIERETSKPEEKPLIASVFYNRLKKGMILQSDPTVIYGLKDFNGNLTKGDMANRHNYNTYVHPGLPPGPICNPGEEAIKAALNPAKTNYMFFVSKNDGTHQFSETFAEHQNAVRKYQLSGRN